MAEAGLTAQLELQAQTQRFEQQVKAAIGRINPVKLQLDSSKFSLGRITSNFNEFNKSLDASTARVSAFAASAGVIFVVQRAFRELVKSTIDVEKSLTDINVILNLSQRSLRTFGNSLFDIAKNTGKSFKDVTIAATEFSRQGLGASETLKRTRDALILTRLAGLDTADSVKALTTAINSFSSEALDSSIVLNKLAAVDAKFAVSSKDLAESLQRVGSTAADAGVNLDELLAIVTTVAQTTGRGGAVIGNAFKTIFTRIQRPETLDTLEELGVGVRDLEGNIRPALGILTELGRKYDDLSAAQRQQVDELTAGVFQINVFKAAISNLGKPLGTYDQALKTSVNATSEAFDRIKELNQTLSDQFNRTVQSITEAGAKIGSLAFKNPLSNILGAISGGAGNISELLDGEGVGAKFAQGIIKGIGNVLAGPGLVVALALVSKIALKVFTDLTLAGKNVLSLAAGAEQRARVEEQIAFIYNLQNDRIQALLRGNLTEIQLAERLLTIQREILATRQASAALIGGAANIIIGKGQGKLFTKATGHVPNAADGVQDAFIREQLAINQGVGGASRGARPVLKTLNLGGGPSPAVVNSDEKIIRNFAGTGQDAVFNKSMIRQAGGDLERFGRVENAAIGNYPLGNILGYHGTRGFSGNRISALRSTGEGQGQGFYVFGNKRDASKHATDYLGQEIGLTASPKLIAGKFNEKFVIPDYEIHTREALQFLKKNKELLKDLPPSSIGSKGINLTSVLPDDKGVSFVHKREGMKSIKRYNYDTSGDVGSGFILGPLFDNLRGKYPNQVRDFELNLIKGGIKSGSRTAFRYTGPDVKAYSRDLASGFLPSLSKGTPNLAIPSDAILRHYYKKAKKAARNNYKDWRGYGFWDYTMGHYNKNPMLLRGTRSDEVNTLLKKGQFQSYWGDSKDSNLTWVSGSMSQVERYANRKQRNWLVNDPIADAALQKGDPYILGLSQSLRREGNIGHGMQGETSMNFGLRSPVNDSDIRGLFKFVNGKPVPMDLRSIKELASLSKGKIPNKAEGDLNRIALQRFNNIVSQVQELSQQKAILVNQKNIAAKVGSVPSFLDKEISNIDRKISGLNSELKKPLLKSNTPFLSPLSSSQKLIGSGSSGQSPFSLNKTPSVKALLPPFSESTLRGNFETANRSPKALLPAISSSSLERDEAIKYNQARDAFFARNKSEGLARVEKDRNLRQIQLRAQEAAQRSALNEADLNAKILKSTGIEINAEENAKFLAKAGPKPPSLSSRARSFASNRLDIRNQNIISEGAASRLGQGAFAAAFLGPTLASSFGASEKQQKNISDLSGNLGIAGIAASLGKGPIGLGIGAGVAAGSIGKFALAQLDPDFEKLAKEAGELAEKFNQQNESINTFIAAQSNLTEAIKSGNPNAVKRASEAAFQAEQGLSIGDRSKFVGKTFEEREAARAELNKKQLEAVSSKNAFAGLAKNSALGGDIVIQKIADFEKTIGTGFLEKFRINTDKRFFSGSDEGKDRARKFAEEFVRGGGTQKTLSSELSNAGITLTNKEDELEIRRNIELYSKLNAVLEDKAEKEKTFNTSIASLNKEINTLGGKLKFLAEFDNLKKDNAAKLGIQGARGRINTFSSFFSEEQLAGFEGGLDNLDIERESRSQVNSLLADFKDSLFSSIKDANLSQTSKGRDFGKALIERTLKGEYDQGDIAAKLKAGILEFEQQGVNLSSETKTQLFKESDILAQKLSVQAENLKYQKKSNDLATKQKQEMIRVNNALKSFGGIDQFLDTGARQKSIGGIIGGVRNAGRRVGPDVFTLREERNKFAPTAEGEREFRNSQAAKSAGIGRGQLSTFRSLSELFPGDENKPFIEKLSGINRNKLAEDIAFTDSTDINSIQKTLFSDFSGTQAFQTRGSGFQQQLSSLVNKGTPEGTQGAIDLLKNAERGARNSQLSPNDVQELTNIREQLEALKGLGKNAAGAAGLKADQALGLPTEAGKKVIEEQAKKVELENQRNEELFKAATSTATNTKSIEGILEQIRQLQAVANANLEKITGPKEGENSRFTQGEVKGSIEFNQKVQGEVIVKLDQNGQVQVTDEGARKKIDEIMAQLRKMGIVFTPSTPAPVLGVRG